MSVQPTCARPQDLPVKADLSRLRVRYRKDSRLAFLGHLDLISTVERCVRRSGLPFSIGNGFARRMRIQFSSALPTGTSSVCEYFDVRLTEEVDAREALERLRAATPGALAPSGASYVPGRLPALEAWLDRAAWEVTVECGGARADDLLEGIEAVRGEGSLTYLRGDRAKTVDVGVALAGAGACDVAPGVVRLELETRSSRTGALRPQVLVAAALERVGAGEAEVMRVRRTGQWHEEHGRLVEPLGPFGEECRAPLS